MSPITKFASIYLAVLTLYGGGGTNQAPVAKASLSGEAVLNGTTRFDTTGSADPEGKAITRQWAYGDGQTGSLDTHVYTQTGSFTAVLTVTDDQGLSATKSVPISVVKCSAAGTAAATASLWPTVCIQTSMGEMVAEVYGAPSTQTVPTPITAANFLKYVDDGFYTGIIFHRVIAGFMIQAGGFTSGLAAKAATYPAIALEAAAGLHNTKYSLAMARTSVPNSATSQFYINVADNSACLDRGSVINGCDANGYAVFGSVISGQAVADAISATPVTSSIPNTEVVIRSALRMP